MQPPQKVSPGSTGVLEDRPRNGAGLLREVHYGHRVYMALPWQEVDNDEGMGVVLNQDSSVHQTVCTLHRQVFQNKVYF